MFLIQKDNFLIMSSKADFPLESYNLHNFDTGCLSSPNIDQMETMNEIYILIYFKGKAFSNRFYQLYPVKRNSALLALACLFLVFLLVKMRHLRIPHP